MKPSLELASFSPVFISGAMIVAMRLCLYAWYRSHQKLWLFGFGFCAYFMISSLVRMVQKRSGSQGRKG
jgi:hypothetical protein